MKAGTYYNGELWLRCPHCGDSQRNKWKSHYSINAQGLYHCYKCGAGGKLSPKERRELMLDERFEGPWSSSNVKQSWNSVFQRLLPGPGNTRESALDRYHLIRDDSYYDVFKSTTPFGTMIGLQLVDVATGKKKMLGKKGVAVSEEFRNATFSDHLPNLVEGPYDVLESNDVCTFGIPSVTHFKLFKEWPAITITPDGDIWSKPRLLAQLKSTVKQGQKYVQVEGVQRIVQAYLDPGDRPDEIEFLEVEEFLAWKPTQ